MNGTLDGALYRLDSNGTTSALDAAKHPLVTSDTISRKIKLTDFVCIRIGQINSLQGSNQSFGSTVSGFFYDSNKLNYLALR